MKTTLIAVSGISPAILTETLWALAGESPPALPDEVVVITTLRGEEDIRRMLLTPLEGWGGRTVWESLRADVLRLAGKAYTTSGLQLSIEVITLPNAETGIRDKARDIRTRAENAEAADFILRQVASHADAEDTRVIASIAGGRKTMGALLYAAMSLVGKEHDRVTHVLVNEPFETCRTFFYPEQPVRHLESGPPGMTIRMDARTALIELADIPFVPLRNGFAELNESRRSFGGLVNRYTTELVRPLAEKPLVSLDSRTSQLTVNGAVIRLTGRELLAAAFLYSRAKAGKPPYPNQAAASEDYLKFATGWERGLPGHHSLQRKIRSHSAGDLTKAFHSLRQKLAKHGLVAAIPYLCPKDSRVHFEVTTAD